MNLFNSATRLKNDFGSLGLRVGRAGATTASRWTNVDQRSGYALMPRSSNDVFQASKAKKRVNGDQLAIFMVLSIKFLQRKERRRQKSALLFALHRSKYDKSLAALFFFMHTTTLEIREYGHLRMVHARNTSHRMPVELKYRADRTQGHQIRLESGFSPRLKNELGMDVQ